MSNKIYTLEEAAAFLDTCVRSECRDHAFGDREVLWKLNGKSVAEGYFGSCAQEVHIDGNTRFDGKEAYELDKHGKPGALGRNDSTGDYYYQGY